MDRRDFIKTSLAAGGALALSSCTLEGNGLQTGKMEMRIHPETGEAVSLLGMSCMPRPLVSMPDAQRNEIDQEAVNQLVDYALEHGVNFFETAPVNGREGKEEATAAALLRHPREKYLIATKLPGPNGNKSLEEGQEMVENTLSVFQTDHIDYLSLDFVCNADDLTVRFLDNGLLDWLLEQRRNGRIRHLGFSFHGPKEGFDELLALHGQYHWDFVGIQMNYLDWKHAALTSERPYRMANAEYLYGELEARNIPVVAMEPLLGDRLAQLPQGPVMRLKSREPERSTAFWAFRFCGSFPHVLTIVSGMTYMEELQDNIKSVSNFKPLSESELAFLEETASLILNFPTIPCTACQYCMPCPYGLDIPGIFAHHNECINEDHIPQDAMSPAYRKARRTYLISYERQIPGRRQAAYCVGCGECTLHCPQGINIPVQMRKIDRYTEKLRKNL
ncbi:MAG: aldo/keto reductase [Bacteroidales bacterium]|nr:aldo/keto reductase [Bacteroidales bacterium]